MVETLTFDDAETNLPGPISFAELGARLIEVFSAICFSVHILVTQMLTNPSQIEHLERQQRELERQNVQQPSHQDDTMDMDEEVNEDWPFIFSLFFLFFFPCAITPCL